MSSQGSKIKPPPFWYDYPTIDQAVPAKLKEADLNIMIENYGGDPDWPGFNNLKKDKREWLYMKALSNTFYRGVDIDQFREELLLSASLKNRQTTPQMATPEPLPTPPQITLTHDLSSKPVEDVLSVNIVPNSPDILNFSKVSISTSDETIALPSNKDLRITIDSSPFYTQHEKCPTESSDGTHHEVTPELPILPPQQEVASISLLEKYLPGVTENMLISEIYGFEVPDWCRKHQRELPFVSQEIIIVKEFMLQYLAQFTHLGCFSSESPENFSKHVIQSIVLIEPSINLFCILTETHSLPWQPRLVSDYSEAIIPLTLFRVYNEEDIHIGCPGEITYASEDDGRYQSVTYKAVCLSESRDSNRQSFIYVVFEDEFGNYTNEYSRIPIWDFVPSSAAAFFPKTDRPPFLTSYQWNALGFGFQKLLKATEKTLREDYSAADRHLRYCVAALSLHPGCVRFQHVLEHLLQLLTKRSQKVNDFYEVVEEECNEEIKQFAENTVEYICALTFKQFFKDILLPVYQIYE